MIPKSRFPSEPRALGTSRLPLIDALRGFALLGIVIANLPHFAKTYRLSPEQLAAFPSPAWDGAVVTLQHVLVTEKFYSLFSLLFGISFGLQAARAERCSLDFRRLHRTRMGWLLVIGALHALVWIGDILVVYALVGFLLPLFDSARPRALLVWAAVFLFIPVASGLLASVTDGRSAFAGGLYALGSRLNEVFIVPTHVADRNTVREHLLGNVSALCFRYGNLLATGRFFKVLAMFLLGLWVVRSRLLDRLDARRTLLWRIVVVGLLAGLPGNLALHGVLQSNIAQPHWRQMILAAIYAGGVVPLCLAYAALFSLCWQRKPHGGMLRKLASPGRLALTNYLTQTTVGIALFYGIGCGWAGRVGAAPLLILSLALFCVQALLSHIWLRYLSIGPLEWVWRRLVRRSPRLGRRVSPAPVASH